MYHQISKGGQNLNFKLSQSANFAWFLEKSTLNATSGNNGFHKSVFHAEFKSEIRTFKYGAYFF